MPLRGGVHPIIQSGVGNALLRPSHALLVVRARFHGADVRVTLSTLHGAKGLEFDTVVIGGFDAEHLPHRNTVAAAGDAGTAIEEERRLAYVGMTRARSELYLSVPAVIGHGNRQRPAATASPRRGRWGRKGRCSHPSQPLPARRWRVDTRPTPLRDAAPLEHRRGVVGPRVGSKVTRPPGVGSPSNRGEGCWRIGAAESRCLKVTRRERKVGASPVEGGQPHEA